MPLDSLAAGCGGVLSSPPAATTQLHGTTGVVSAYRLRRAVLACSQEPISLVSNRPGMVKPRGPTVSEALS